MKKTNAITKYNVEGKPSETKLYVDDSKPGDQKGKIKNFIIDPLGYLLFGMNHPVTLSRIYGMKSQ